MNYEIILNFNVADIPADDATLDRNRDTALAAVAAQIDARHAALRAERDSVGATVDDASGDAGDVVEGEDGGEEPQV